ncbi:MAG: isochorismatase family protein [Actinobacteria bacterium]|nr:isochorismatase family protein [Actinomycetota bacterium]
MSILPLSNPMRVLRASAVLLVAGAIVSGSVAAAVAAGPSAAPAGSTHSASVPDPVPVTVDPASTAYLVLDLTTAVCAPRPGCVATLPAAAALLARARAAGAMVVYSQTAAAGSQILPEVAPLPGDPVVTARADKFFNTDLDSILSSHGIKTLVLVGTAANGAVLYTTFEANLRGYTVVVAEDGVSANSGYITHYTLFQLLNQPGFTNPQNTPLKTGDVTLSTGPLVTFGA